MTRYHQTLSLSILANKQQEVKLGFQSLVAAERKESPVIGFHSCNFLKVVCCHPQLVILPKVFLPFCNFSKIKMCDVPIFALHSLFIFLCYRTLKSDDSPPLTALNLAILQVFIASLSKLCWNKNTPCRTCGYQMLKSGIYNRSR